MPGQAYNLLSNVMRLKAVTIVFDLRCFNLIWEEIGDCGIKTNNIYLSFTLFKVTMDEPVLILAVYITRHVTRVQKSIFSYVFKRDDEI